jgi:hypothetical protein
MWTVGTSWDSGKQANGVVVRAHYGVEPRKLFEAEWHMDATVREIANAFIKLGIEMAEWANDEKT